MTGTGGGAWGQPGVFRMVDSEQGGQIAWLIPTALIFAVSALIQIGRAPRTDRHRACIAIFGLWMEGGTQRRSPRRLSRGGGGFALNC